MTTHTRQYGTLRDHFMRFEQGSSGWRSYNWDGFSWAADWFDHVATLQSNKPALVFPRGSDLSYGQLSSFSQDCAHWLASLGVEAGSTVVVQMTESPNLWILSLALDRVGAFQIQIQPHLTHSQKKQRVPSGRIFTVGDDRVTLPDGKEVHFPDWSEPIRPHVALRLPHSAPMWGYYTSGTTGAPKLVTHSRVSYAVGHLSSAAFHQLSPEDRHANLSGPGWAKHAWSSLYAPFASESTYVSLVHSTPESMGRDVRDSKITSICASPRRWGSFCAESKPVDWKDVRAATCAGEVLKDLVRKSVRENLGLELRSVFGMSEMTAALGEMEPGRGMQPLPGYEVRLPERRSTGPMQISKRSIGMMLGYLRGESLTPPQEWFSTGDRVSVDDDGFVSIQGRDDEMLNVDGHLMSPSDVESRVSALNSFEEVVVYQESGGDVVARVVASGSSPEVPIPPYPVDRFEVVDDLAKTPNGKLIRPH